MNEERKPKKLNIKKIAVVALSVIMIMATFCLSAFADNPLTSKSEYIASAENLPELLVASLKVSDDIVYPIEDKETGEEITIYFNETEEANEVSLSITADNSIILSIGSTQVLTYLYNMPTGKYKLSTYQELNLEPNKNEEFTAREQIKAINEAIDSVLIDQSDSIKETFSKYKAKDLSQVGILSTFLGIGTWIGSAVSSLIGMFYLNGSLTFIGYLAVAALAVSVVFLLIYLISSFLKFRG